MRKCVAYILGTSFSGSSLLNCLLDSQPGMRGLGEAVHFLNSETTAWCAACRSSVLDCTTRAQIDRRRFYESLFQRYPDAHLLVNSSKTWKLCFWASPLPPRHVESKIIVLSKSPHAFAHSYAVHYECDYETAFRTWVEVYSRLYERLCEACIFGERVVDPQRPWPTISSTDVLVLTYQQVARRTATTIRRTCDFLGRPFSPEGLCNIWESDTCTIGGNTAIYAQRVDDTNFFQHNSDYLAGKYAGRERQIFVDDCWRRSRKLIDTCAELYRAQPPRTRKLIQWLGHDSMPDLKAEAES